MSERPSDQSVLRDWLSVLSRQKWIVLLALVVAPLLAFVISSGQQRLYQASATVLLTGQSPTAAQALNLTASASTPPDRYAATQAQLARVRPVAMMAVRDPSLPHRTATELLANSSVSADPTGDLLTFSVTDPSPAVAMRLSKSYATAFTVYRHRLDTAAVSAALRDSQRKLDAMTAAGQSGSPLFRRLAATQSDLQDVQTLQQASSSARLVGFAGSASLVQPKTGRNVILAILVGLALGVALAFLRDTLDTRVRSADELRDRLGVPLLGQVPRPRRRLATLSDPTGPSTEAFRILKNNLEICQLEHHAASIAITTTNESEDGTATAANLAVILARSGRHVILVDLDLRHPNVDRLFGLSARHGLTSVAVGGATLVDALREIEVYPDGPRPDAGTLEVLTVGQPPPDPGGFLHSSFVAESLEVLEQRCDVLLIDTPPLLTAGDAMAIAPHADALILVAGVGGVRRQALADTRRLLERCPTFTLGVIATDGRARERANLLQGVRSALARSRAAWNGPRVREASRKLFAPVSALIRRAASGSSRRPAKKAGTRRAGGRARAPSASRGRAPSATRGRAPSNGSARAPSTSRRKSQKRPQRVPDG